MGGNLGCMHKSGVTQTARLPSAHKAGHTKSGRAVVRVQAGRVEAARRPQRAPSAPGRPAGILKQPPKALAALDVNSLVGKNWWDGDTVRYNALPEEDASGVAGQKRKKTVTWGSAERILV
mmetsp:Transcript_41344/g.119688  ORF Transcript_41344/g.119688 Transcript_41344/m.119688 type:complete len:121 (-) Transcript_41344:75-437(-)